MNFNAFLSLRKNEAYSSDWWLGRLTKDKNLVKNFGLEGRRQETTCDLN